MTTARSASPFTEAITKWWLRHDEFDPCGVFTNPAIFIESYAIRAALQRVRLMEAGGVEVAGPADAPEAVLVPEVGELPMDAMVRQDTAATTDGGRLLAGAYAFCDRVVRHQGVQGPPEALMMGYEMVVKDGVPSCACVADQASIASAVVDTVMSRPDHPRAGAWRECIERYADWVLANFIAPSGAIGVGIFGHQWNPITEYWCATSLAGSVIFKLARLTGRSDYEQAALGALGWLAQFDHTKVEIPTWTDCAPEVALYSFEGMVEGIRHLVATQGVEAAREHPVLGRFEVMAQWLVNHQDLSGRWPEPLDRGYRDYSCGLPWQLLEMEALVGPQPPWQQCARRVLADLASAGGEEYYGLYVRPFTNGLAWMSTVTADLLTAPGA